MTTALVTKMVNAPLTYPYFDMKALRAAEPMDVRFTISTSEIKENEVCGEYTSEHMPEMIFAQYQAAKHILRTLKAKGISSVRASELSGLNKTLLSKVLQGKRPFSPTPAVLSPFAFNVMNQSCHTLMFGTEGTITLPSVYAETAKAFASLSETEKAALLRKAIVRQTMYEKQNPVDYANCPHRDLSELIGERIFDLIHDRGVYGNLLLGPDTPYGVRNFLRQFFRDDFKHETPRLSHLMYLAFEMDMSLDYFIAEDFTRYAPCVYKEDDKLVKVTDRNTLRYLGICSAVPSDIRSELMGEVIGLSIAKRLS